MSARRLALAAAPGLCLAVAVSLAGSAFAQSPSPIPEGKPRKGGYTFAGIPWLTSADSAVAMLVERGYTETPNSREKDAVHATGKLFDRYAVVTGMLDEHKRIIRWEVNVPSTSQGDPYLTQRRLYDDAVAEVEAKYGRRRVQQDRFRFPYERGDGRQSQALREGYASIRSEWGTPGRDHLTIALDRASEVVFTYESPWWTQSENDRRKKKAKDL